MGSVSFDRALRFVHRFLTGTVIMCKLGHYLNEIMVEAILYISLFCFNGDLSDDSLCNQLFWPWMLEVSKNNYDYAHLNFVTNKMTDQ